jgi:hypothetical protein
MAAPEHGIVRGYREIRALLGVRMETVYALVRFDAARPVPFLLRTGRGSRAAVRATAADVWSLWREFEAATRTGNV